MPLGSQVKVRLFLDGFNLLNAYAAETITTTAGANFQQPTAIIGAAHGAHRLPFDLVVR